MALSASHFVSLACSFRASSSALAEEHQGQLPALGEFEEAVLLAVVLQALGTGQHRVVVGDHHAARVGLGEALAVYVADTSHQTVRGRVADQVVEAAAAELSGDVMRILARDIMPTLVELLGSGNKVIQGYADDCATIVVRHVRCRP